MSEGPLPERSVEGLGRVVMVVPTYNEADNLAWIVGRLRAARERFKAQLVHFGFARRDQYRALLAETDIVVSTAIHEFFGIAMIEAIHAGAMPLLPHRLAYPEIIPSEWHESVLYTDLDAASARLAHWLRHGIPPHAPLQQAMARFAWPRMAAQYDECFDALCTAERP